MSVRQEISDRFVELLGSGDFDAPYGILQGMSGDRRYRSVTFGIARYLDAEIRIYSSQYIMIKYNRNRELFRGDSAEQQMRDFIKKTWDNRFGDK